MIVLLPLRLAYCDAVAEIAKESLPEHWSLDAIKDVLNYNNNIYYVACDMENEVYEPGKMEDNGTEQERSRHSLKKEQIIGFAGIMLIADEAELLNIALRQEYRGTGTGRKLLEKMLEKAKENGAGRMLLEVRKSNKAAIDLYEKYQFTRLGERKNYYSNPTEDAIIMECVLNNL